MWVWCISDKEDKHLTACRRAQTSRMLCLCLLVYVMYVVSQLSTLVLKVYLSSYTFLRSHFVRELLYQEMFSLHLIKSEWTFVAEFASRVSFVVVTYGEDASNDMTDSYTFLLVNSCTLFDRHDADKAST